MNHRGSSLSVTVYNSGRGLLNVHPKMHPVWAIFHLKCFHSNLNGFWKPEHFWSCKFRVEIEYFNLFFWQLHFEESNSFLHKVIHAKLSHLSRCRLSLVLFWLLNTQSRQLSNSNNNYESHCFCRTQNCSNSVSILNVVLHKASMLVWFRESNYMKYIITIIMHRRSMWGTGMKTGIA